MLGKVVSPFNSFLVILDSFLRRGKFMKGGFVFLFKVAISYLSTYCLCFLKNIYTIATIFLLLQPI